MNLPTFLLIIAIVLIVCLVFYGIYSACKGTDVLSPYNHEYYEISDTLRLDNRNKGAGDLYGEIWLQRKINGQWIDRASMYSSMFYGDKQSKINTLLTWEQQTFDPFKTGKEY